MSKNEKIDDAYEDVGSYIIIDGVKRKIVSHPTEFSVEMKCADLREEISDPAVTDIRQLSIGRSRVAVKDPAEMEDAIRNVRSDPEKVAHRIYLLADTGEEINITDRIFLTLKREDHELAKEIAGQYKLDLESARSNVYTLKVTTASGRNPIKIANEIAGREDVESCAPKVLFPIEFGEAPAGDRVDIPSITGRHVLFERQWHLATENLRSELLHPSASINATQAWEIAGGMGDSSIVIAVIDDGFDLSNPANPMSRHNAFRETIVDTAHMRNFGDTRGSGDNDVSARSGDFHGTSVASLISARGDAMLGVAPGCTFLPIRIGASRNIDPETLLRILREVAPFADIINCSFSMKPHSLRLINNPPTFISDVQSLMENGGRRPGKGLALVFSAGNDDAPISMSAADNRDGITFTKNATTRIVSSTLGPGQAVHCGYSEIPGAVVVGAVSSLKRKAGYSNWGDEITVVAPSSNGHDLVELREESEEVRRRFPGLGIVAAINRPGDRGTVFDPIRDNPRTPNVAEDYYTEEFGGTSAAAAIVSGVLGLMLSVNHELTAKRAIEILKETADDQIDRAVPFDFTDDPNLRGVSPDFINGRSRLFGSGKVNAARAVEAAIRARP